MLLSFKTTSSTLPRLSFSYILRICSIVAPVTLLTYYILFSPAFSSTNVQKIFLNIFGAPTSDDIPAAWAQSSLSADIDGEFDGTAIKAVCGKKRWEHRAAISCGRIQGGVGNVRNVILTCLRFAIEAGSDFVIPDIQSRSESDLSILDTGESLGFEYMFDEKHFKKSLKKLCPRMRIYGSKEKIQTEQDSVYLAPLDLVVNHKDRVLEHEEAANWGKYFERWLLNQEATNAAGLASGPIPIEFESPLFHWPVSYDDEKFARNFGRLLQFREDTRKLATTVLQELQEKFELDLEPSESTVSGIFGAHLRTAADAAKAHWTDYSLQAARYLEQAAKEHISIIYVATGSAEDMKRFSNQAWSQYRYNTTSKIHLLQGDDLTLLESLSWDQQGLVDFLVMLRCSSFAGIEQSSFAWNIALKRHTLSSNADYLMNGEAFRDEYSMLLGRVGAGSFIAHSMWP